MASQQLVWITRCLLHLAGLAAITLCEFVASCAVAKQIYNIHQDPTKMIHKTHMYKLQQDLFRSCSSTLVLLLTHVPSKPRNSHVDLSWLKV